MTKIADLQQVFGFLSSLGKNNNREWFNINKSQYLLALKNMEQFADAVISRMNQFDNIETKTGKRSLFRIYRDTRFSKDKTPYKTHWAGHLRRATSTLRGGYYYQLAPGGSFIAGGFFGPNAQDLKHIRAQVAQNQGELSDILNHRDMVGYFGPLQGTRVKTAPKGYSQDDPAIQFLRYKQFILKHEFPDDVVLRADFADQMVEGFLKLRPFFDYMSELLNTDLNGVPLEN